ncbi:MKI67 FHA domain-interacting nucleolar phosphoprotein [Linepithema humile]|uniref:MKI67 FHA domain-interacting nucleolar phosphoprotein n=1 Tax=Linepithema humile TaxID=83485 RepID=UPI0006237845|nr:PREDICTED: MKI67 FHA domain-interacting nucleolar phosphoprotein [Linepithema humile]
MKTKKEDVKSKKSLLNKTADNKKKIPRPKAGASLEKAVENVKQIFKEKEESTFKKKIRTSNQSKQVNVQKSKSKGIVYVGHLPHGFYEEQMKDYFQQFGNVTRVRVSRSKKTGKSRGYGYVEFFHSEVAKVAAESMNNYLMCGRLLKAKYIPPENQHSGFFSGLNWSEDKYPKLKNRKKAIRNLNRVQHIGKHETYVKRTLSKLSMLESKLQKQGISIKFQPADVLKT